MILPIGRRLSKSGYTLIELILLAIIILIIVGISTPQFRKTFSDLELKETSYSIAKLISFAQEKSILEATSYKLILNVDEARYYLVKPDPKREGRYIRLKKRFGKTFLLPRGVSLKSDKKEVLFYPDGHSEKATITLRGKEKKLKLIIKGNLGYVQIKEIH